MARIDDYKESFRIASQRLKTLDASRAAELAGANVAKESNGTVLIDLPFFGSSVRVQIGEEVKVFENQNQTELSLPEKILVCHYLIHASSKEPTGHLITFRQIPDGHFYFDAFQRRARDPLLYTFGSDISLFEACADELGGTKMMAGDIAMSFQVLPKVTIHLVLWSGDDEFPPEASMLFDESIQHCLPVEDIAVLSGMLVYRLMGMAKKRQAEQTGR